MTLFSEVDWSSKKGGEIAAIAPGSVAEEIGLQVGDELLAVNDETVTDVIDVQYYAAEEELELLIRREDDLLVFEATREYGRPLGLEFDHPTFDVDIRRCNNLCEFCFVLQMAPRFRRSLYIKDDDYRYSFLFGHFVTLTNLTEHDWWRIETMRLSPLYISVHVTDLQMRRKFLRNPEAPDIVDQLTWLAARGIKMHTQLVVVPGFNDGPYLEQSVRDLGKLWPAVQSVSVVPVGLTRHHKYGMRIHTPEEAEQILDYVERQQGKFQEALGKRFVHASDEWYLVTHREVPAREHYDGLRLEENGLGMVRRFLEEWRQVRQEIKHKLQAGPIPTFDYRHLTLVTGTLFAPTLASTASEFAKLTSTTLTVRAVNNVAFGQTITVAGLLTASDVIAQLQDEGYGDLVVLPRSMFGSSEPISLDDVRPQQLAEQLNCPVALADTMGDVWDALRGVSSTLWGLVGGVGW